MSVSFQSMTKRSNVSKNVCSRTVPDPFSIVFMLFQFQCHSTVQDCSYLSVAMPEPSRKREHDQLLHVLNGARVSEDLIKYLTGLGLSSISDFVGLVTTAGYETELKTQVLDLSPAKDDVLVFCS